MGKKKDSDVVEMIDALDSKHESLIPVLLKLAGGESVSQKELNALADSDSRLSGVVPVLREIANGEADDATQVAIESLDSFGDPLKPVLSALAQGDQVGAKAAPRKRKKKASKKTNPQVGEHQSPAKEATAEAAAQIGEPESPAKEATVPAPPATE